MRASEQGCRVLGLGYEGHTPESFIAGLLDSHVDLVVDVRLNAISRKPGFSKTALSQALAGAGIGYKHAPELGNPAWNRPGFAGSPGEAEAARAAYRELLRKEAAVARLDCIAEEARKKQVALLCVEADQRACHRDIVLRELSRRTS